MTEHKGSRGFAGAVLKLMRAGDYRLTVTGRREISPHYLRLSFNAGGMLAEQAVHPTMWIRMWFADAGKLHQRGYTLVDPDPAADTVDVEFALHDGIASQWARAHNPGTPSRRPCWAASSRFPSRLRPGTSSWVTAPRCRRSIRCSARSMALPLRCFWRRGRTTTKACRWPAARMSPGWTARTTEKPWSRR